MTVAYRGRRATASKTFILAAMGVLALILLLAAPVQAHKASSHDFESVPESIVPPALGAGITFEMTDYDSQIRLQNDSGREVVVKGYDGEPYARLDPDGAVYLNSRSPAFYLNQDRYARTAVDPSADPSAPPKWVRQATEGEFSWFDKRSHSMQTGPPPSIEDTTQPQAVKDYGIPLEVDGQPAELKGTLYWSGKSEFPMGIVAGLLVATFICAMLGVFALEAVRRSPEESPGSHAA
ncbi:MAG: hypothetical protein IPK93_09035 [Solirubrobacterales bacterium]|nr:hypothetical protein [Solirubrobacterales bacterium]